MSSGLDKTFRRFTDQLVKPKPNSILYNRFVLYFVFFVALSNLFIAAFQQNYMFCTYFVLIGFILTFFNKNMLVVLVLTIAFANILSVSSREGMDTKEGADDTLEYSEVTPDATTGGDKTKTATTGGDKTKTATTGGDKAKTATSSKEKSKSEMVDDLKKDAEKLIDTQNKIIGGFEKIDPYMKQAEQLIEHIDTTAKKIESINKSKTEQFRG